MKDGEELDDERQLRMLQRELQGDRGDAARWGMAGGGAGGGGRGDVGIVVGGDIRVIYNTILLPFCVCVEGVMYAVLRNA